MYKPKQWAGPRDFKGLSLLSRWLGSFPEGEGRIGLTDGWTTVGSFRVSADSAAEFRIQDSYQGGPDT
jgi:hypothetical protein